jgi:hypothetical protein
VTAEYAGDVDGQPDRARGEADGVGKQDRCQRSRGRGEVTARSVETDERVEVDHPTSLELGDLHERQPAETAELGGGQTEASGQGPA